MKDEETEERRGSGNRSRKHGAAGNRMTRLPLLDATMLAGQGTQGGGRRSREMTEAIFIRVIKFLIVEFVTMNSGIFYLYGLKDECKRKVMLSFTDSKWRLAGSSTINSVVAASVRNSPQKVCNLLSKIK